MNAESLWDAPRWRDLDLNNQQQPSSSLDNNSSSSSNIIIINNPLPSEPATRRQSMSYIGPALDHHHHWLDISRFADSRTRPPPPPTEPYTDASHYQTGPYRRHTPSPRGEHGPSHLATASPNHTFTGSWQASQHQHQDLHRNRSSLSTDAPLTLHIPPTKDLPRISPAYGSSAPESQSRNTTTQAPLAQSTSLPSFAALQERTTRPDDPRDGPETAPASSRPVCYCSALKPLLEQTAVAILDLVGSRQGSLPYEFPSENPVRALEWILERAKHTKGLLQSSSASQSSTFHQQKHGSSPPYPLKRVSDSQDPPTLPPLKRPRSDGSTDMGYRNFSVSSGRDDYRPSYESYNSDSNLKGGRTPPAPESHPSSAYPRPTSPSFGSRLNRPLPSPSSVAYPFSGIPPINQQAAPSAVSPTTSHHPPSTIHTASTSSATSQHIADLQHQVTLKSLALQTLQSEYSTLLQKLQRERVKSQTIEKKTSVAEQEVNELTGRNEDLMEQIKSLDTQVEESEKKREADRVEAQREKEQWGRMLELGGKLHARNIEDRQRLLDEKAELLKRINLLETGKSSDSQGATEDSPIVEKSKTDLTESKKSSNSGSAMPQPLATGIVANAISADSSDEVRQLKRQVSLLKDRTEVLRLALEEVKRHNQTLEVKAHDFMVEGNRLGNAVDRALKEQETVTSTKLDGTPQSSNTWNSAACFRAVSSHSDDNSYRFDQTTAATTSGLTVQQPETSQALQAMSLPSPAQMAAAARATSPGPAELGIHVIPSTSSPEELVKALGPVPAPIGGFSTNSSAPSPSSENSPDSQIALHQVTNSWPFAST